MKKKYVSKSECRRLSVQQPFGLVEHIFELYDRIAILEELAEAAKKVNQYGAFVTTASEREYADAEIAMATAIFNLVKEEEKK